MTATDPHGPDENRHPMTGNHTSAETTSSDRHGYEEHEKMLANAEQPPLMLYLIWSNYTQLAKNVAAATVFGSSIDRATKLVALPADLISRFEAAQDPFDLAADTPQIR